MSPAHDFADKRLESASRLAVLATVSGLALTFFCLILVRLLNSAVVADGSLSIGVMRGPSYNADLLTFALQLLLFLIAGLLPALLTGSKRFWRLTRLTISIVAALVVLYGLLVVALPYLGGGSPNYLSHFYTLVGGYSLSACWLVFLSRVRAV